MRLTSQRMRWARRGGLAAVVCAFLAVMAATGTWAVSAGSQPGSGGFTWGVGVGGAGCRDVVEKIRRNWTDVRGIIAPDSKEMRPRRRDFYCVSPQYTLEAMPKHAAGLTGLKCFDIQGKGFCCDSRLEQCATM